MNEYAMRQQINYCISNSLIAIENRNADPSWFQQITQMANNLSKISVDLETTKANVAFFGRHQINRSAHQNRFSAKQSIQSKTDTAVNLQQYIIEQWQKVSKALQRERLKNPWVDKNQIELINTLVDNIESFQQLVSAKPSMIKSFLSSSDLRTEVSISQRELTQIQMQPTTSLTSLILVLAFAIRMSSFLLVDQSNKKTE